MIAAKILKKAAFTMTLFLIVSRFCCGQTSNLFESEAVLELSLKGDLRQLFKNTSGEPQYFDFTLGVLENNIESQSIQLRVRTRGHFRRELNICDYPPLLLNFAKENSENTLFSGQDKLKLVVPCRGEKYVMREFYAYKVYNLLTPKSFKVRLVRLSLIDESDNAKSYVPFLCFLIEEEDQMAHRNQMTAVDQELVQPHSIETPDFLRMAVFQYLIGNTDWSIQYRQNIKLMNSPELGKPIAVPYDFDHAGIVRAPYANPAPELKLPSVIDRRYRGYCIEDMAAFETTFSEFLAKKEVIYALYSESDLMDAKSVKTTLKFLDGFYGTISNPKRAKLDFQYPCLSDGTGNVIIKGMN